MIVNFLLTEREVHAGEYWPEVVAVYGPSEARSAYRKTTEGQYFTVQPERASK